MRENPERVTIISSSLLSSIPGIKTGMSTREGGVSPAPLGMNLSFNVGDDPENVRRNREIFFREIGIDENRLAAPRQVHGTAVRRVDAPGVYPDTDALITNERGVYLSVSVADCAPVLVVDAKKMAIAAVHSGWRGTRGRITSIAIRKMIEEFSCSLKDMIAYVGPCASVCCYSVGDDVASTFDDQFVFQRGNDRFVDLKMANEYQLLEAGISPRNIEVSPYCTISDAPLFHSHRRDKEKSGRMMAVIGIV
jgi:YfiH family protein